MEEQMEKKFTWVFKNYSSWQDARCYSRAFAVAGCNWHILARREGDKNNGHLGLYLEIVDPESLPQGWKRDVKFSLTLVTKAWGKSSIVLGAQLCFDANHTGWGFKNSVSLTKLHAKDEGFLVNNKFIVVAQLHVLPAIVVPAETVKVTEPDGASVQGDSSCQAENASKENLDEDEDTSKEGSDDGDHETSDEGTNDDGWTEGDLSSDDASSPDSDDGGRDISLSNQSNALVQDRVAAETEVSNGDNDDAPKEDEASSLVLTDSATSGSSLDKVKSLEDAILSEESGGRGFNTVASATETETANNLLTEIQPAKETIDVNGFGVFSSQVESVRHIFKRHPDIALGFRPKNQQIRRSYMNELLSLIEIMCQSPDKLSEDDLSNADDTLADLIDVGFKLDWLKTKLNDLSEKKKMQKGSVARIQTMEEQLQKLKLMFLDLETQLHKEKAAALAARAPLSFEDVVC